MNKHLIIFIIVAVLVVAGAPAKTGNLVVTVINEEGNILPGASVMISSNVLMGTRTQITGTNGKATFRNLPPGEYTVEVNMDGFSNRRLIGVQVLLSKTIFVNVKMELGAVREVVEVVGTGALVDTTSSSVSTQNNPVVPGRGSNNNYFMDGGGRIDSRTKTWSDLPHDNKLRNPFPEDLNTEEYKTIKENPFLEPTQNPLSTFSIDVDTASYTNVRRFLNSGEIPPTDAVRIEEMINYFDYNYPQPKDEHPFSITTEVSECPWAKDHRIALIGLKGKELSDEERKPSNLVFLIDVSGSMKDENKLPLLKRSFKLLVENLNPQDSVAIVVYASAEGVALQATPASDKAKIISVIESLESGGCTAGAAGIKKAYDIAEENFIKGGNNRIILATDGDFNVGVSNTSELVKMIEEKRKKGIYLTILGFGMGNYKDGRMEEIADKGNGNYFYIDNFMEGKKVLVDDLTSTLFAIAKDVKIQVEFNPVKIKAYRLIGYENRMLNKEDFKDDTKDAGELGAGHTVTALYEIVPAGLDIKLPDIPELKYQKTILKKNAAATDELMTVKLRYKPIGSEKSIEMVKTIEDKAIQFNKASENLRFAASVASFGMLLRNSEYKGNTTYKSIYEYAKSAVGDDQYGYRAEFLKLVKAAKALDNKQK